MGHLTLKVFPASKREEIIINSEGSKTQRPIKANGADITVRLCEKAQDNKANIALTKLISKLARQQVRICAGAGSRLKVIEFEGESGNLLNSIKSSLNPKGRA
ncbi:MAG: DUF167 domain-containing protein [Candidatus Micrarchaeota archaeon]